MIFKAAEKYNIDLSQSYMVGDDERDVEAGKNAGCIPIFLAGNVPDKAINVKNFNTLYDFAEQLIK